MTRLLLMAVVAAALNLAGAALAAPAPSPSGPPGAAATAPGDLYTVANVRIDATAESAQAARDLAMSEGRPEAWTKMYRRLTPSGMWPRQPRLSDAQLFRLIRSFE